MAAPATLPRSAGASTSRRARTVRPGARIAAHMPHAGQRRGRNHRRKRGGEDEARRAGADVIHHRRLTGDIATMAAECLGQRALDRRRPRAPRRRAPRRRRPMGRTCQPRAPRRDRSSRHSDRPDRRSRRSARYRHPSNTPTRTRSAWALPAVPRAAAPRDARGRCAGRYGRSAFAPLMPAIIDAWLRASENTCQSGQRIQDRGERRLIGYEAGGEQQRRRLAVQVRKLRLQRIVRRAGAADVARAAGAGAHRPRRGAGSLDHHGMAAHAEIVVGRPDQHLAAIRRGDTAETAPPACAAA